MVWGLGLASTTCSSTGSRELHCPWEEARGKEVRRGRKRGRGGLCYHSRVSLRSCQAGCVCLFHYCSSTAHHCWHLLRAEEQLDFPLSQKGLVKVTPPYCFLTPPASLLLSGHLLYSHSNFVFLILSVVLHISYMFSKQSATSSLCPS